MSLKKFSYLLAILLLNASLLFVSCNNSEDDELLGNWDKMADFDNAARSEAVAFVINNMGYVATGANEDTDPLRDMMAYDATKGYWVQKASLPDEAKARYGAVAFSISNKGYVGTGFDDKYYLKDFWAYDATTNTWTKIADFPGTARRNAVAFALNNKGYVGTGYDDNDETKDFYEYSPSTNTWNNIPFPGSKKKDATTFVIGTKAYIVTGTEGNGLSSTEFYSFDGTNWTKLRKIDNSNTDEDYDDEYTSITRNAAVGFAIGTKGYLATGSGSSLSNNVWEYNPDTDLWTEKTKFYGSSRTEAVGFAIGNYGYVATGRSSGLAFDDLARFAPTEEDDESYE